MPEPETRLGPYEVVRRLGAGGMGEVYLARDTRLERSVALKLLPSELSRDPEQLARFRQEALTLAALNHPNIATIFGFEEPEPGTVFLVLEFIEGGNLADRIAERPLAVHDALQVCAQIAEALEVAHERGVIHRDLKPGNVMIGSRGLVKVVDFGLSRAGSVRKQKVEPPAEPTSAPAAPDLSTWDADRTFGGAAANDATVFDATGSSEGVMQGTPGYMSPEQVRAGAEDERTDVFAFGCVLYECLTGRKAFGGENAMESIRAILERTPDWTVLPRETPRRVRDLLTKSLEKDAGARLAEIRTARIELEEALGIRRAAALRAGEAVATPHNLPKPLTSFVGRERERATCQKLLDGARLLTLVGMGGSGKTRLALQVAEDRLDEFPDGVWFVDLAPVTESGRLEMTVSDVMGLREEAGRPLTQTLVEHLKGRRSLIVLDNCEHLVRACAGLATLLLHACPEVKLLATSRQALGVDGEVAHDVGTMGLPRAKDAATAAAAAAFDSVRLFVERAQAAQPSFEWNDATARPVVEICRQLDGIPLAIELAAARVKVLSAEDVRARLVDRFRLLTGGSRSALPRQQTLLATLQWSYDQLVPREQEVLRRLAAFTGGWTLEAATAVCDENGDEFEILDLLTDLVGKSLVVVDRGDGGRTRYRFLETVRHYSLQRLEEAGEAPALRGRHLAFFLRMAQEAEGKLTGPEQGSWSARLSEEHENLLAALSWCGSAGDGTGTCLRMANALWRYWSARGHYELGRRALEDALGRGGAEPEDVRPERAMALVRASAFAMVQGDYASARPRIEESLEIYRALGDRRGEARSLTGLGTLASYQGDFQAARSYLEQGLALYRELGNLRGAVSAVLNLGFIALCLGDLHEAKSLYEESVGLSRKIGDREHMAMGLADLSFVETRLGRRDVARGQLLESFTLVKELGAKREGAYGLESAAELALSVGEPDRAAGFYGSAEALREVIGAPLVPSEQALRNELLAKIRDATGEEGFRIHRAEGAATEFEAAVEAALAWLQEKVK